MKKTLLTLVCALAVSAVSAKEITDDFSLASKDASEVVENKTSDNGVTYTFTNVSRNNNNALMMTNDNPNASFTATLTEQCTQIVLNGADNTALGAGAKIKLSVGETDVETVTVNADTKTFTFVIPEQYQAAGTSYTFTRVGGNNRIATVTYTTVDKESWVAPEFNIPENCYVFNGQTVEVTNVPEDATVGLSYRVTNKGEIVNVEGNSFEVNITSGTTYRVFVTATFSGNGKESSTSEISFTWTNGKRPVIDDCKLDDVTIDGYKASFNYTMAIVNRGKNKAPIKVTVKVYNGEELIGEYYNDTNNVLEESETEEAAALSDEISPVLPEEIQRSVIAENLPVGNYTFTMEYNYNNGNPVIVNLGDNNTFSITGPSGIEDITTENTDAVVTYYNMQGVRVLNPQHGQVLIRIMNGNATKVVY